MIYFTGTAYRERYRAGFQSNISVYTANVDRPVRWVEVGLQPMSTDRGQGLVHWWNQYKPTAFCNSCSAGDDPAVHAVDHRDVSKHDAIARPSPTTASVQRRSIVGSLWGAERQFGKKILSPAVRNAISIDSRFIAVQSVNRWAVSYAPDI